MAAQHAVAMDPTYLIVSHPPHGDVDRSIAAESLGLALVEAQMRLNHPAPQIWLVRRDVEGVTETAHRLQAAGANVRIIEAGRLGKIRPGTPLRGFEFGETALICRGDARETAIPYDWSAAAISCHPEPVAEVKRLTLRQTARAAARKKSFRQEAKTKIRGIEEPADSSFVDLYFWSSGLVERFTARPGRTEFSGLGAAMKPITRENVRTLIAELGRRFQTMHDDRRLDHHTVGPGIPHVNGRSVTSHLADADPALRNIEWYDLLSRLAFLTWE